MAVLNTTDINLLFIHKSEVNITAERISTSINSRVFFFATAKELHYQIKRQIEGKTKEYLMSIQAMDLIISYISISFLFSIKYITLWVFNIF